MFIAKATKNVSQPYLGFCFILLHFIVECEQNIGKYAEKWAKIKNT